MVDVTKCPDFGAGREAVDVMLDILDGMNAVAALAALTTALRQVCVATGIDLRDVLDSTRAALEEVEAANG